MKIKINKKVLFIIGIVIFAIAMGSLVRSYSQQVGEQEQLRDSMSTQQVLLNNLNTEKADWENKRAEAQALLDTSQAEFPEWVESIEYGEDLFKIAEDCNVDLTELIPSAPTAKKVGAATYYVAAYFVKVMGNIDDTLEFIQALRTGEDFQLPWSAVVKGITMDIGTSETSITLDIYAYER
jgi:type II secretory pathway pseudopilin PulG